MVIESVPMALEEPSLVEEVSGEAFPPLPGQENVFGVAASRGAEWRDRLLGSNKEAGLELSLRYVQPAIRDGVPIGVCPPAAVEEEVKKLSLCLVGFFMGKRPTFDYVVTSLRRQWRTTGTVDFCLIHQGGFKFTFSHEEDRMNVLSRGLYHVGGKPLFVKPWQRQVDSGRMGINSLPLWVSLPGLPLHLWGDEALSIICSVLGTPLFSDRRTKLKERLVFAKACIDFSAKEELKDSITSIDDEGNEFVQPIIYDWKPPLCTHCKVFGHTTSSCKLQNGNEVRDSQGHQVWKRRSPPSPSCRSSDDVQPATGCEELPDILAGTGAETAPPTGSRSLPLAIGPTDRGILPTPLAPSTDACYSCPPGPSSPAAFTNLEIPLKPPPSTSDLASFIPMRQPIGTPLVDLFQTNLSLIWS